LSRRETRKEDNDCDTGFNAFDRHIAPLPRAASSSLGFKPDIESVVPFFDWGKQMPGRSNY
jgi:hypothetical protein